MKRVLICAAALFAGVVGGCSPERSRAVRVPQEEREADAKDYQAMLAKSRTRTGKDAVISDLISGLERFRSEWGRLPTNLVELVRSGMLREIPAAPVGTAYAYDPRSGNIRIVPVDSEGHIAVPEDTYEPPALLKPK